MDKEARPILRTALYVVLIIAGLLIYAYGWQATDISLEEAQKEERQELVTRALRGLLSPYLFERDSESQMAYAPIQVPCTGEPLPQSEPAEGQPYITLTPNCGVVRDEITIEGFNYRRYSDGFVRWTPPGGTARSLGRVRTDGEGHFRNQLRIPTVSESDEPHTVEAEIQWPVGWPRASEPLKITVDRMIETIFLALMATTLAIVLAFPLSFIAAYNLMRPIRTPLGSLLAALLPLPFGWLAGMWLLRPVSDLALRIGNEGWLGALILVMLAGLAYLGLIRYPLRLGRITHPWLAALIRYGRMVVIAAAAVFVGGLLSGVGTQMSLALSDMLGGILGNILGTLAELLGLLLTPIGGVAGALILGSVAGRLLEALLERIDTPAVQRTLGLVLGAAAGALLLYLVYRGIFGFYRPGEPVPYLTYVAIGGAVAGAMVGAALGADYDVPVGLLAYYVTRTILNALRSIEPLIMAIIFVIWVGLGPFAGVLALTLHSIAALGKLYSEQVESIDTGPIEAITATGATRLQTIVYGVIPQIIPPYIAFTLYRWDINVRMSTIIGFVGGGGIGQVLKQWIDLLQYRQAGVATLAIAIVVSVLDYASARTRERII
jgi:phosphonate ABC transporter permease subunit PhnE